METMLCLLLQSLTIDFKSVDLRSTELKDTMVLVTLGALLVGFISFMFNIMPPRTKSIGVSFGYWIISLAIGVLFGGMEYLILKTPVTALVFGCACAATGPYMWPVWIKRWSKKVDPTKIPMP